MSEWEEWLPFEGEGTNFAFPCLMHLNLSKCPKLRGNLPSHLPSLTKVSILECNQLEARAGDLHWSSSIEEMHIREGGKDLLSMLDNFSYWELSIDDCDNLRSLPRKILGDNCLQRLTLSNIPSLISFPTDGLPTSLQSLNIYNCENLEFLSHETWHKYTSLEKLKIWDSCHSLTSFPLDCFPALLSLYIRNVSNLEAITIQGGGGSTAPKLTYFNVSFCKKLSSLSALINLHALKSLDLFALPQLVSFSPRCLPSSLESLEVEVRVLSCMTIHELGLVFQCLSSLSSLSLWGFGKEEDVVNTLLKEQILPTSLQSLWLCTFEGLKLLEGKGLQHLTSLELLCISDCGSLESLPEDQLPSCLEILSIRDCPLLEERYQSGKGKYWSTIAHIPAIEINDEVIIEGIA